jgi:hypothetical protein
MPDRLASNQSLAPGQTLTSRTGRYTLSLQADGNLVLYGAGAAYWASKTQSKVVSRLVMQDDGNLVLYDRKGGSVWASGTNGHPGAFLLVQDDGNVVVYHKNGGALWSTDTSEVAAVARSRS